MRLLVEQLAARAWPAAGTVEADGRLLRPRAAPETDVVEDFYARRGRLALVQIAPDTDRPGNTPARALYASAGFTRSHGYHYRAAPA